MWGGSNNSYKKRRAVKPARLPKLGLRLSRLNGCPDFVAGFQGFFA
jgi:hypothetical protein